MTKVVKNSNGDGDCLARIPPLVSPEIEAAIGASSYLVRAAAVLNGGLGVAAHSVSAINQPLAAQVSHLDAYWKAMGDQLESSAPSLDLNRLNRLNRLIPLNS